MLLSSAWLFSPIKVPLIKMQEGVVDLSLAVNYLPACVCIVESTLLSLGLCAAHAFRLTPAYVGIGLCLAVGRLMYSHPRIMDKSSILLGIFLAHAVFEIQESGDSGLWHPYFQGAISLEWPALAGYRLLLGAPKNAFSAGRRALHWEFAGACAHVAACAFYGSAQPEPRGVRVARYMAFCLVSLCWMYVVGIFRRRVTQGVSDSTVYFAVYFWPIMYVHPYVAAAYSMAVLVSVAMHLAPAGSVGACSSDGIPMQQVQAATSSARLVEILPAPAHVVLPLPPPQHQQHQKHQQQQQYQCDFDIPAAASSSLIAPMAMDTPESVEELEMAFRQAMLSAKKAQP